MDTLVSNQIRKQELIEIFEKNYQVISPLWSNHQLEWINGVYEVYKDHDKFLIVIYLINKTFIFYSKNFIKLTFAEFFEKESIEIDTFNVMEISKALNIPKESARRKINELVKSGAINKTGKKIILDKSLFPFVRPDKSIIRVSRFLSNLSHILYDEKILTEGMDTNRILVFIQKNFSFIWKLYYEVQIPMLLNWKFFFKDIEIFHIWAACLVNQKLNSKKEANIKVNRVKYIEKLFINEKNGINAMSISDITGIPRATVIRKLNILIKKKYLKINNKKHYTMAIEHRKKLYTIQKINFANLAEFTSRIFNLFVTEQLELKEKYEKVPFGARKYLTS